MPMEEMVPICTALFVFLLLVRDSACEANGSQCLPDKEREFSLAASRSVRWTFEESRDEGIKCRDQEHENRDVCSWAMLWPGEITCTNDLGNPDRLDAHETVAEALLRWHCAPSDGGARWSVSLDMHCRSNLGDLSCATRAASDCYVVFDPGFALLYGFLCALAWFFVLVLCACVGALAWFTHCCWGVDLPFPSLSERTGAPWWPVLYKRPANMV
jgi:hypothetical protein